MALTTLVDVSTAKIGATVIARPESAEFSIEDNTIESASDAVFGAYEQDITYYDLKASINAQDPMSIPTIAAITAAGEIAATGQLANAATFQTIKLAHGVLIGIGMDLNDNQVGKVRYDLQNRAASATATVANEYSAVSGSAPSLVVRRNSIRLKGASSTFTPDGGAAVTLEGLGKVTWNAQAQVLAEPSSGSLLVDQLTILGWKISGSIAFSDKTILSAQGLAARLAVACRGTLVVTCRQTGFAGESAVADATITMQRIKFGRAGEGLRTRGTGSGDLQFNGILRAAAGTLMTLAEMISVT